MHKKNSTALEQDIEFRKITMKKQANFILFLAISLLTSFTARAEWSLENAFFYIDSYKAVCTDCESHPLYERVFTVNADIDVTNRYLMTGRIEVNLLDNATYASNKIVIKGVKLQMAAKGLILDLSLGGNSRMRLMNLSGKKINDIFTSPFSGGKLRINAIANLSLMVARNKQGISLLDNESLFTLGIAVDAVVTKLKFSIDNTVNEVAVYDSKGAITTQSSTNGENLLSTKLP